MITIFSQPLSGYFIHLFQGKDFFIIRSRGGDYDFFRSDNDSALGGAGTVEKF